MVPYCTFHCNLIKDSSLIEAGKADLSAAYFVEIIASSTVTQSCATQEEKASFETKGSYSEIRVDLTSTIDIMHVKIHFRC